MKSKIDSRAVATVFVVVLCLIAVSVSAIDLEEYLELVKENHPFFQKEQLAVEVEQSKRETLLPRYEWNYSLLPQYTIADGQVSSQYFENLSQNVALQAGMERSYADGRRMGFSVSTGYTWMQNPPITMEENSFQHGIEASFSWSLEKNIERLTFADSEIILGGVNASPVGQPTLSDNTPFVGDVLTVDVSAITDADNVSATNQTGNILDGPYEITWEFTNDQDPVSLPEWLDVEDPLNGITFHGNELPGKG